MTLTTFQTVLAQMPLLEEISLVTAGEPLLNPNFSALVKHAKQRGIRVRTHSHFSLRRDEQFFDELVKSGLDELVLSIDGATQKNYEKYRVGGELALVLQNIETLTRRKVRLSATKPRVTWKFLVNRHNESEVERAREKARELGVEFLTQPIGVEAPFAPASVQETEARSAEWESESLVTQRRMRQVPATKKGALCSQLFTKPAINPDGLVFPCCYVQGLGENWGDLKTQSFSEIWQGKKYRSARDYFTNGNLPADTSHPCVTCPLYQTPKVARHEMRVRQ